MPGLIPRQTMMPAQGRPVLRSLPPQTRPGTMQTQVMPQTRPVLNAAPPQAQVMPANPAVSQMGAPTQVLTASLPPTQRSLPPTQQPVLTANPQMGVPAQAGAVDPATIAAANAARWRAAQGMGTAPTLNPAQQQAVDAANAARWQAAQSGGVGNYAPGANGRMQFMPRTR